MVFNPVGERGEGEEIVLVNPIVNKYSKKIVRFNEGCLSFPGIYADVEVFINADSFLIISFLFSFTFDVICRKWPLHISNYIWCILIIFFQIR